MTHASDCAIHNAPAMEPGKCDCGAGDAQAPLGRLPRYKSHKVVIGLKIDGILEIDNRIELVTADEKIGNVHVDREWFKKFGREGDDQDFGYFVQYEDGYRSWSPTKAFEEGYTLVTDEVEVDGMALVALERERCAAIVQLAREGEIDQDLRSIIHRIENP